MKELHCHCAHHAHRLRLLAAFSVLLSLAACRPGTPVIDLGPKPLTVDGTISGTVRGPEGTSAIDGRTVEAINTATGERQRVTTNNAGGFTFKVKPGKYRVELTLQEGETLVKHPDVIDINKSDLDTHVDFVVGVSRISGRRYRPRGDDGLGSPIA
ncbi:MAG: carboxypeptidase-like regulatory domain-containing protein [Acidobacteriota bacterium]